MTGQGFIPHAPWSECTGDTCTHSSHNAACSTLEYAWELDIPMAHSDECGDSPLRECNHDCPYGIMANFIRSQLQSEYQRGQSDTVKKIKEGLEYDRDNDGKTEQYYYGLERAVRLIERYPLK